MAGRSHDRDSLTGVLEDAGCVAASDEAGALLDAAAVGDAASLDELVARRCNGEPLAWLTGQVTFCGLTVGVSRGVYVPRWQSEPLAVLGARLLPPAGVAVDLGTGAGAVAMVLGAAAPGAVVLGTEIDPVAAACARANGVDAREGSLDEPLPADLGERVDVMTGVLPYVPTEAILLLPRDVAAFEPLVALDGGEGGVRLLAEAVRRSVRWLRPGGWLLLELGGDQLDAVRSLMDAAGFGALAVIEDDDGDVRGVYGRRG